jgi:hypothetical protein
LRITLGLIKFIIGKSGWRDLNPRPLVPQTSALTKLRYSPYRHEATVRSP